MARLVIVVGGDSESPKTKALIETLRAAGHEPITDSPTGRLLGHGHDFLTVDELPLRECQRQALSELAVDYGTLEHRILNAFNCPPELLKVPEVTYDMIERLFTDPRPMGSRLADLKVPDLAPAPKRKRVPYPTPRKAHTVRKKKR